MSAPFNRSAHALDESAFIFAVRRSRENRPWRPEVRAKIFTSRRTHGTLWAMAVLRSRAPLKSLTLRQCRKALGLSQAQFAAELGVPPETYRTWDSGRRHVRPEVLARANACALRHDPHALLPLDTLALLVHVHVRTLHAAAKDGRLRVTYDTRTTFRRLRTRATLADAEYFLHAYFETAVWPTQRPAPLRWDTVPPDCAVRIRNLRQQLGMTLTEFAAQVGAACKAVVYQWESQKRCPSPLFWQRIQDMEAGSERIAARAGDS